MSQTQLLSYLIERVNARACSAFCACLLISGGMYMCFSGLAATGTIDLKTALFEGQITSGSLGLLSMFLGVFLLVTMNLCKAYSGQEVKLIINGKEVVSKGVSYRKLQEILRAAATPDSKADRKEVDNNVTASG